MCVIDWTAVAAWVQAIGSIAAILAAIWIGERSSKQARELVDSERVRQADIVAATVEMRLFLAGVELRRLQHHVQKLGAMVSGGQLIKVEADALRKLCLVYQTEGLALMRPQVTIFDRATGIAVMTALDTLESYDATIEAAITFYDLQGSKPGDLIKLCQKVLAQAHDTEEITDEAAARVAAAHNLREEAETEGDQPPVV